VSAHEVAEAYRPVFTGAAQGELDELLKRYPTKMAALLPALWIIQRERGWVSADAMVEVAEKLDLTPAYVKGVVTFYTMYHQHPVGKHFIQVCTTSPCGACGAEKVVESLLKHSGCGELGATSPDGRFTVIEVECLGACGFATPVMVNDEFIESVTPDKVPQLLSQYR
jgi:NADH-quinone oxidoreductase E subunit